MNTIYQFAQVAMDDEIAKYLKLIEISNAFANIKEVHLADYDTALLFAGGIGSSIPKECANSAAFLIAEYERKTALDFDVETAVCIGVYSKMRPYAKVLFDGASSLTDGFKVFNSEKIKTHPYFLPVFQNILRFSKAQLIKKIGSVSDLSISGPASIRLANLLSTAIGENDFDETNVLQRMEVTLEGIVRDLVGRVLLEEVVAHALEEQGVKFLREEEYSSISGVVYDFRADFVLPDASNPIAFIEVRKSSSRHASLYSKDKMFSAINWKGKHKKLIGVVVVEGEWTQATLRIMATVFDYVVPLSKSNELAKILRKAQDGDETVLKWLIDFSVKPSPKFGG